LVLFKHPNWEVAVRTALVRPEVQRLLGQRPFRPFALLLENGDRVIIEHPENIAFDPVAEGVGDFYVISGRLRLFGTFEAVTSVTLLDAGGEAASA
jgi:hypothetical protein